MLCIGVIQFSAYYLASATVRPDHFLAVAQPDAALYLQAARRIAEGAPFSYSAGEPVCTGTTSVLYPFVLAPFYALGLSGGASVLGAFLLNGVFYVLFLLSWARVIDLKVEQPAAKAVAAISLALFGQFALVSFAQSDIGMWLCVSSFLAWGLAADNPRIFFPALLIGPWVRPEGMVCVVSFSVVSVFVRRHRLVSVLALASVAGVFLLNWILTGDCHFSSVQGKGHFATEPFCQAALSTVKDLLTMLRQLLFGLSSGKVREMFFPPMLGAGLMFFHLLTREYDRFRAGDAVFLIACLGGFGMVATSGWQGSNYDRYLAWVLPVAVIWMAQGALTLGDRLKGPARFLPLAFVWGFLALGAVGEVFLFRIGCEKEETARSFYTRCETVLPTGASLGGFGNAACAHWLSPRRFAHLSGIYSMDFNVKETVSAMEVLKREPTTRFDSWLCDNSVESQAVGPSFAEIFSETQLLGPCGLSLRKPDWTVFDAGAVAPSPRQQGLSLRARVDVGYEPDERNAEYEAISDYCERSPDAAFRVDMLGGVKIADVGRVLRGGDEMTVKGLVPGRDLHVLMRTVAAQRAVTHHANGSSADDYGFASPLSLFVVVDGQTVRQVHCELPDSGFSDVNFVIPGAAISSDAVRIGFIGGHAAFGYWFYQ